jgi:hypothetical protein
MTYRRSGRHTEVATSESLNEASSGLDVEAQTSSRVTCSRGSGDPNDRSIFDGATLEAPFR